MFDKYSLTLVLFTKLHSASWTACDPLFFGATLAANFWNLDWWLLLISNGIQLFSSSNLLGLVVVSFAWIWPEAIDFLKLWWLMYHCCCLERIADKGYYTIILLNFLFCKILKATRSRTWTWIAIIWPCFVFVITFWKGPHLKFIVSANKLINI